MNVFKVKICMQQIDMVMHQLFFVHQIFVFIDPKECMDTTGLIHMHNGNLFGKYSFEFLHGHLCCVSQSDD